MEKQYMVSGSSSSRLFRITRLAVHFDKSRTDEQAGYTAR